MNKKLPKPPGSLGVNGKLLWCQITEEYEIRDSGGLALLLAACRCEDDICRFRSIIAKEGDVLRSDPSKPHPLHACIRGSEAVRRQSLRALNLDLEANSELD